MNSSLRRFLLHMVFVFATVVIVAVLFVYKTTPAIDADNVKAIDTFTTDVGSKWLTYALTLAAVGTLAMALLETIKALFDIRQWFHVWKLRQWLGDRVAFEQLLYLAIGDRERTDALCAQPLEKMMGQIQAAANVALDFPDENKELCEFLTTSDVPDRRGASETEVKAKDRAMEDRDLWMWISKPEGKRSLEPTDRAPSAEEVAAAQARIRLSNLVSRKLDAFQLRTQYYWERANQLFSILFSVVIVCYALGLGTANFGLRSLALGLIAGLLSPFAKDLATGLAQFAKK